MKMLLIYPPQWNPANPYLSVPLLAGQLKRAGYDVRARDINVEFFNYILTSEHIEKCFNAARDTEKALGEYIARTYPEPEKAFDSLPVSEKTKLLKFKLINEYFAKSFKEGSLISKKIDDAVSVLRSKERFYDPEQLFDAKKTVQEALKIASLPFRPNELIWDNYFANSLMKMDWVNIDSQCKDPSVNMFIDWFYEKASEISEEELDFIGISVPDLSQMIPAFTLARILKEKTSAHIQIGGNYITQNKKDFLNHPEIFGEYVDSLATGDGEKSVIETAEFISGKRSIEDVHGIIAKREDGSFIVGKEPERFRMSEICRPCFDGYDFSLYFSPETVLPVQLGKGCYWGKCSFCDYYYGQQCFDIKKPESACDELEYYKNTYGIKHFMFIDEAVPPAYYDLLSKELIKRDLGIYFYSFARLEKEFTPEVLSNMYKAGARILLWGYECHSERIMEMMNKGIDTKLRLDIMRQSHEAGIWNNALFIIGYPTETDEEIEDTLNVIKNNRDIINSCTPSNFSLKKNALIMKTIGKDGVLSYETNGEFYTVYKDKIVGTDQQQRREIRRQFHLDLIREYSNCLWPVVYSDFDSTLLYMAKYGLDYTMNYRSDRDICLMFR